MFVAIDKFISLHSEWINDGGSGVLTITDGLFGFKCTKGEGVGILAIAVIVAGKGSRIFLASSQKPCYPWYSAPS